MQLPIINCDLGEGAGHDEALMPLVNWVNIACGYHAGDVMTMQKTVELALKNNVAIGAHPSYLDREKFGRTVIEMDTADVYDLVTQQLLILNETLDAFDVTMHHVKPHGALYNMASKNPLLARTIAMAVKDFDPKLLLVGLSGSHSIREAKAIGLQSVSEVFADRSYENDGSLTPRKNSGALIEDVNQVVNQVLQIINEGTVTSASGKTIPIIAETICIHGDGKKAVVFAEAIQHAINK
jgi:UPF0271 protein